MSNSSSRLAHILGEMRREMNGAVVGSMRFYGAEYGLNYGVSLATIRQKVESERSGDAKVDHKFARLLYQQEVRELRLAAFWLADQRLISVEDELPFWANGIINSEVAEEAAFALLHKCEDIDCWLDQEGELLHYAAVMAIAKRGDFLLNKYTCRLLQLLDNESNLLPKAIVILLSAALKNEAAVCDVEDFLEALPSDKAGTNYIREEISWRLEFRS